MLNSPASREMAAYHIATHTGNPTPGPDPKRAAFLGELEEVGWFPQDVSKRIAVANGPADGKVRTVPAVTLELEAPKSMAVLYGQAPDNDHLVADLRTRDSEDDAWDSVEVRTVEVRTSGISALDGAPGGTLASNQIAVNAITEHWTAAEASTQFPWVCFVPTVSALDFADPETSASTPIPPVPPEGSNFHAYKCASVSSEPARLGHTLLTEELCTFISENLS